MGIHRSFSCIDLFDNITHDVCDFIDNELFRANEIRVFQLHRLDSVGLFYNSECGQMDRGYSESHLLSCLSTCPISLLCVIEQAMPMIKVLAGTFDSNGHYFADKVFKCILLNGNGSNLDLTSNRRQAITWTNADQVLWRHMASLDNKE